MSSDTSYVEEEAEDNIVATNPQLPSSPPNPSLTQSQNELIPSSVQLSGQRLIPSFADHPFAQGEDAKRFFTRPNRYFGPASTWKSWTEEERTVAQSLDRVRSQDLAIHLFNSFCLKRKAEDAKLERRTKRFKKGDEQATSIITTEGEDDEDAVSEAAKTLSLPKNWTAWPMPPGEVPREDLLPLLGSRPALRSRADTAPSANLEQWLIACATRFSRGRWNDRRWQDKPSDHGLHSDTKITTPESDIEGNDMSEDESNEDSEEGSLREEDTNTQSEDPEYPVFSSRAFSPSESPEAKRHASVKAEDEDGDDNTTLNGRPVPLADDEKARQYFLPSARHILAKLDDLLLGLHRARYAYASKPSGKARGRYSNTSDEQSKSEGPGRSSSRPARRKTRRRRSSSAETEASAFSSASTMSAKRPRRVQELGLRDWSDVLGMASLTGWDSAVVERASERCATLFGQNMLFRTFHEGEAKEGNESHFTEHLALESEDTEEPSGEAPGQERICPHGSCPRHTVPFHKRWKLQRHLATVHGTDRKGASLSRPRLALSRSTSVDFSDADMDMLTHPDLIVCPIPGCMRGQNPFSTGRGLYDHVRRMHPDVDVKKIKQMESRRRGERRGKWTRDRRRSESRRRPSSDDIRHQDVRKIEDEELEDSE
ncbi:hypothetical protein LTR99_009890 [Exophiala xenobiotica]|uniref:Rrn9 domain-containing protein n=1 Tax=Vermiconidia calcicola TaxID=1690605 RepID=A0AAV9Q9H5_9PEZI|nr:hypothetical protein LTR92_005069 [Exophiala xenobiotica]KAK5533185.1 hypothetical protein LTR23_009291 [Chaetothyriales sp. CCFEE 6169]KAK5536808.1 hypothetical protein LTR25_005482 [Vermiconidia calcicola]KAK5264525.1 hypothetical protein LTR96_010005 [Exophiala xenobiotica]KAK5293443.1 hypothetical protein LTR99_009890 [Exophiala xenobiotica]